MRKVIMIGEEPKEESKGVEFTHELDNGYNITNNKPSEFNKIVYLGNCDTDGDMFAAYSKGGCIYIYKGNLNNGTY